MAVHNIKKGLALPIVGEPEHVVEKASPPSRVALVAADYHGMKPTMHVASGDRVQRGQLLFEDKKNPGVRFTAPATGEVVGVHRGAKRALQSVVVELDDAERSGTAESLKFEADTGKHPGDLTAEQVVALLVESGLWTALRARPYSRVASPSMRPHSIFVTAMDSNPLAPPIEAALDGRSEDFERGLVALSRLTEGQVYVCAAPGTNLPLPQGGRVQQESFAGPHPAGTVGIHIHTLDPVDRKKLVWHAGYQDVLAIGRLFAGGGLDVRRIVSLAGPSVSKPRLLATRIGASVDELVANELSAGEHRVISGSVLSGRTAQGELLGFLGRYHNQVSALAEDRERELLGWMGPGGDKFSVLRAFTSALTPGKKFAFTTSTQGSHRAIVPVGALEKVFPFDILPSFMMRSIVVGDIERAEALGVLELDEEDVALCSFVCSSKIDYGVHLRDVLTTIEKEG